MLLRKFPFRIPIDNFYPTKMKTKLFGFTLIELLVVIVILGILATISIGTFSKYFGKARNSERQSAVQSIATMIKVDSGNRWGTDPGGRQYEYNLTSLQALFDENDYRMPAAKNGLGYYYGFEWNNTSNKADFFVAVEGENEEGPFIDGTSAGITAAKTAFTSTSTIGCTAPTGTGYAPINITP